MAAANERLVAAQARVQSSRPVGARVKSAQDRLEGMLAKLVGLRAERAKLLAVINADVDIREAVEAAQGCKAELERLHLEALSATPVPVESQVRQVLVAGHAEEALAALLRAVREDSRFGQCLGDPPLGL